MTPCYYVVVGLGESVINILSAGLEHGAVFEEKGGGGGRHANRKEKKKKPWEERKPEREQEK